MQKLVWEPAPRWSPRP